MEQSAHESYLESQIVTATPQKLRLMLIDGAIRFARQTLHHWEQGNNEQALEAIVRCRRIICELLASIRPDESELTKQVAGLYMFIFRHLTEAQLKRDAGHVEDVIRVLQAERDTWQQVCEQMPEAPVPPTHSSSAPSEIVAPPIADMAPTAGGGFSLDA